MSRYRLTPSEHVTVVRRTPAELVVDATYAPAGRPPPAHLHPAQDEHFAVLEGTLSVRLADGTTRHLGPGEQLAVPRATAHQMWNADPEHPARVRWTTTPAGRTEAWFAALDAATADRAPGAEPDPVAMAPLLHAFADTFRLALDVRSTDGLETAAPR